MGNHLQHRRYKRMKILIIEDEEGLRQSIDSYLTSEGFTCSFAKDYTAALQKVSIYDYDCILLDLTLPGGDGLEILHYLKSKGSTDGVIIISARNSLDHKIEGLTLGADDYITKPFHLSELNARIDSVIRRRNFAGKTKVVFNEIVIDTKGKQVQVNDNIVYFTKKEFDLLLYFIANKNKVISKAAAVEHIWGDDADMADSFDFIYTHIKNIRKKLLDAGSKDYFQSVYGVGYKIVE